MIRIIIPYTNKTVDISEELDCLVQAVGENIQDDGAWCAAVDQALSEGVMAITLWDIIHHRFGIASGWSKEPDRDHFGRMRAKYIYQYHKYAEYGEYKLPEYGYVCQLSNQDAFKASKE